MEKYLVEYERYLNMHLSINMERGWPSKEQLELSMPLLDTVTSKSNLCQEVDYRSYAGTGGIEPLKSIFADIFKVSNDQIYIGGTMSTSIMYDIVNKAVLFGFKGYKKWGDIETVRFICPSPGYEKHFKICEAFGIEMIPVKMNNEGPDMDEVERIVQDDEKVKGIWCVPLYSNPTGCIYSETTIKRLARMRTKAEDFRIFWDNAYFIHHLTQEEGSIISIHKECNEAGNSNRVFEFASTSKITFPGSGVGLCISSVENIKWLIDNSILQLKTGDKINQYRHYLFFKDSNGLRDHMRRMSRIIYPKFKYIEEMFEKELGGNDLVSWSMPRGGYFITVKLLNASAKRVYQLCKDAGLIITKAGSIFPYGQDPEDAYIRLAPTICEGDELKIAVGLFCAAVKVASNERGREK